MSSKLSSLRCELLALHDRAHQVLGPLLARDPLLPGTVYTLRRRCGKPTCRCTRGELHATEVLSYRGKGRTQTITPRPGDLPRLRALTGAYQRFRQTRTALGQLHREMMVVVERIEALRIEEGEERFRALRSRDH